MHQIEDVYILQVHILELQPFIQSYLTDDQVAMHAIVVGVMTMGMGLKPTSPAFQIVCYHVTNMPGPNSSSYGK